MLCGADRVSWAAAMGVKGCITNPPVSETLSWGPKPKVAALVMVGYWGASSLGGRGIARAARLSLRGTCFPHLQHKSKRVQVRQTGRSSLHLTLRLRQVKQPIGLGVSHEQCVGIPYHGYLPCFDRLSPPWRRFSRSMPFFFGLGNDPAQVNTEGFSILKCPYSGGHWARALRLSAGLVANIANCTSGLRHGICSV